MVRVISNVKQEIIAYRKIIKPEMTTLRVLEMKTSSRYLPEALDVYFDDVIDAGERVWDILENYKEIVEALEGTNETVIQHRLNDILLLLTIISVVLLPLTLIQWHRRHERAAALPARPACLLGRHGRHGRDCPSASSATSSTASGSDSTSQDSLDARASKLAPKASSWLPASLPDGAICRG